MRALDDAKFAAMAKELSTLFNEGEYEAFLRRQSLDRDHSFLLTAIKRSNLRPSVRKVIEELIRYGKIRRANHRPTSEDVHMKGLYRALCVLDIEAAGCPYRDAAIEEARQKLNLSFSTIEKAVIKYGALIEGYKENNPEFLDHLRAAFK